MVCSKELRHPPILWSFRGSVVPVAPWRETCCSNKNSAWLGLVISPRKNTNFFTGKVSKISSVVQKCWPARRDPEALLWQYKYEPLRKLKENTKPLTVIPWCCSHRLYPQTKRETEEHYCSHDRILSVLSIRYQTSDKRVSKLWLTYPTDTRKV